MNASNRGQRAVTSSCVPVAAGAAILLLLTPAGAGAQLPTCFTTPPGAFQATANLVRDPAFDLSPQVQCPSCSTPCTGGGSYCYDCWNTDGVGGFDYCCYDYNGSPGYESCGANLDWYHQSGSFSTAIFPSLDLRVRTPSGGSSRVACKPLAQACTSSSSASHCTTPQFTFSPSVVANWKQKDFSLFGVSDCTSSVPFRKRLVGEHRERFLMPQGSIKASPNPCVHDQVDGGGNPYCTTTLTWETTNPAQPYVVVFVRDNGTAPEWSPPIPWKCVAASSTPTTFAAPSVGIKDEDGITFELWPTASCAPPWPSYPTSGTPLDAVVVTAEPEGTVLCALDDQPMRQGVDIGIITNGITFSCFFHDLGQAACYQEVADKLAAIGVKYHRISTRWDFLYPGQSCSNPPPPTLNFERYDPLMEAFSDAGIEGWITFDQSPCWYSSKPDPFPSGCTEHAINSYPPVPEDTTAWAAWLAYVEAIYDRYGPTENSILEVPVRNWEAWQEPSTGALAIDPVSCPPGFPEGQNGSQAARYPFWEDLQRSVYDTIAAIEGDPPSESTVWSANIVLVPNMTAEYLVPPWIDPQMATVSGDRMFNGFNLHAFLRDFTNSAGPNPESSLESMVQMVKYSRTRLNASGGSSLPLALTATSWYATLQDPWEFLRELPDEADRAQFLRDTFACQANAGADKILWFNATDYGYECGSPSNVTCANFPDPDCVAWGLGLLRVEDGELVETPLYCAFADLCRHLDGCTVAAGVCE